MVCKNIDFSRSVLLGHGIESREMAKFSNLLNLEKGHGLSPTSKYYGKWFRGFSILGIK